VDGLVLDDSALGEGSYLLVDLSNVNAVLGHAEYAVQELYVVNLTSVAAVEVGSLNSLRGQTVAVLIAVLV
jgi:hypothetical protein